MGQILSWIRGPRDTPALQDKAEEEQSQSSQTPPTLAAQVSTVKPAQSESASSGSGMSTKPGVVTTTTGGSATVGAAGKETPKAKLETNTSLAGATVIDMSSAEASGGNKEVLKTAPSSQDKVTPTVPPAAGTAAATSVTAPKESPKDTAKSTAASTAVKADAPKVDPAKTSKPAAVGKVSVEGKKEEAKTAQTKVQAAVLSTAAKGAKEGPAVDPIDELADILPSSDPVHPDPVYTGLEVRERDITPEKAQKCGERDDTLPPGYRFENLGPAPVDVKPAAVPKPISTDDALDSLSAGFTLAGPDKQKEHVETIGASTAAHANFAPPPVKKAETPAVVRPTAAPPADKKAKMEKGTDDFSLAAGLPASSKKADSPVAAPPADKKAKMDKTTPDVSHKAGLDAKAGAKPKTEAGDSMSLDALSALGDTLPANVPKPESPKLKPKDIVSEGKVKEEKGVRVGERDDSLPPEYRFKEEDLKKVPPPQPEPKMDTDDALAILSGDFSTSSAAPPVQAPVVCSSAAPAQKSPAPPADKKSKVAQASDLSLEAGLSATTAKKVESAAAPPVAGPPAPSAEKKAEAHKPAAGKDTKPKTSQGDSMSLDALSALGDTLPADVPKPESPKLKPKDIVSEGKVKKEKGVRVGERDDTLPPEYRFKEEDLKKVPPPQPEPKMDTDDALAILSGDFSTSSAAPPVQAPVVCSSAAPAQKSPAPPADKKSKVAQASDLSLEAGLSATTAKKVESAAAPPVAGPPAPSAEKKAEAHKPAAGKDTKPKTSQGDSMSLDALSALGDTLPADVPKPESPKLKPKDIVSEGKVKKEKGVRVGERDDTLPPEYRFKEEDLKKVPPPQPEPKMDTDDALAILSGDFSTSSAAPPVQAPVVCSSAAPAQKSPAPPADKKSKVAQASDLSLEAGLSATTAKKVESAAAPPVAGPPAPSAEKKAEVHKPAAGKDTKPKTSQGDSMSLDALSALGDTLPADVPKPESPKLKPKDIVSEGKVKKEKGVRVGERDDTLPPEYRFKEEDLKKVPPPQPEPKMDTDDALAILSGDFSTSSAAPPVQAPVVCSSAAPAQAKVEDLSALDVLSRDTVASSKASGLQASVPPPSKKLPEKAVCPPEQPKKPEEKPQQTKPKIEKGDSMSLDALSALGDMLPADVPKPESPKLRPEDIVSEGKVKKEKGVLVGERDDTLPPEYRFKEEDLKKQPASKPEKITEAKEKTPKEKTMDDKTALEMLSSDFSTAPVTSSATTTKLQPPVLDSKPLKPMPGPVLDSLSDTLVPDAIQAKSKTDKPKKHQTEEPSATDQVAAKPSSDVVPTSTKKGAKS